MADTTLDVLYATRAYGRRPVVSTLDGTRDAALDLQLAVLDRFAAGGEPHAGWKVSYTSGGSRDRMGPGYRPFGYILAGHVFASGATVVLDGEFPFVLEPELCLILGAPLRGTVSRDAARAAVAAVAPAFEINQSRLPADATDTARLADGAGQWGIVTGTPNAAAVTAEALERTAVEVFDGDRPAARSPEVPDMDDPFASLASLSALLGAHGRSLRTGDRVITGSFTRVPVTGPALWRAVFAGVGEVSVDVRQP